MRLPQPIEPLPGGWLFAEKIRQLCRSHTKKLRNLSHVGLAGNEVIKRLSQQSGIVGMCC